MGTAVITNVHASLSCIASSQLRCARTKGCPPFLPFYRLFSIAHQSVGEFLKTLFSLQEEKKSLPLVVSVHASECYVSLTQSCNSLGL
jgi:hypothetical protein